VLKACLEFYRPGVTSQDVQAHVRQVLKQKGGIRIEDTVLITADGCEVLTAGVPKEIEEVEALLAARDKR